MDQVADSSIWVDHLRPTTKASVQLLTNEVINRSSLVLCEAIEFELLRLVPQQSRKTLSTILSIVPMLKTPPTLWQQAILNGQRCRDHGIQTGSLDLVIATICKYHEAELVTFDTAFEKMASILDFQVEILKR